ncbi:hypothetical protein Tco_1359407 [Tanacetum coccineum]
MVADSVGDGGDKIIVAAEKSSTFASFSGGGVVHYYKNHHKALLKRVIEPVLLGGLKGKGTLFGNQIEPAGPRIAQLVPALVELFPEFAATCQAQMLFFGFLVWR